LFLNEGGQNGAEQLVLTQQLMNGCPLSVTEFAEFGRLQDDRRICRNRLVFGRTEILGEIGDQRWNMVEDLIAWEDLDVFHRQEHSESLQPPFGNGAVVRVNLRRDRVSKVGRCESDHTHSCRQTAQLAPAALLAFR
jgi:hypothetical protein